MDDLTNSIHSIEMSTESNRFSNTHPKFSCLYKQTQFKSSQEERRKALLNEQKKRRSTFVEQLRHIPAKDEAKKSYYHKKAPYTLMFSEWLEEEPEDFETNWILVICPVGKRCLVVASGGVTTVYNKASKMITRHRSALPGGNNESKVDETVLDCIYDDAKRTYFVLDCLIWKSHPIIETETKFRFYWLNCKLQETPEVTETSYMNPYKFVNIPRFDDFKKDYIEAAISAKYQFQVDGLLFYHSEAHYTEDHTPLVLWLKPYMLQEILNIKVSQETMKLAPSDYKSARNTISNSYVDIQRFKDFLHKNNEQMDVCYNFEQ